MDRRPVLVLVERDGTDLLRTELLEEHLVRARARARVRVRVRVRVRARVRARVRVRVRARARARARVSALALAQNGQLVLVKRTTGAPRMSSLIRALSGPG